MPAAGERSHRRPALSPARPKASENGRKRAIAGDLRPQSGPLNGLPAERPRKKSIEGLAAGGQVLNMRAVSTHPGRVLTFATARSQTNQPQIRSTEGTSHEDPTVAGSPRRQARGRGGEDQGRDHH